MTSLFELAKAGDAAGISSTLDSAPAATGGQEQQNDQTVDVNAKDESGSTALVYAVRGGHEEAVKELLARGADRHEALAHGLGQDGSPIAALLHQQNGSSYSSPPNMQGSNGPHGGEPMYTPVPTDMYGGYQLPDGSIAYGGYPSYPPPFQGAPGQPAFYHDPMMFPHMNAMPYGFAPGHHMGGPRPRASSSFSQSHGRKASAVGKYPPPEVAKTIPCRFYPNCRNGASCIFAHIDMPQSSQDGRPDASSAGAAPNGPSMSSPAGYHMAPGYYAPPGPYAAGPPQFFPMHAMPYGGPHGPMPLHYQPHEPSQPGQMTPGAPESASMPQASPAQAAPSTAPADSQELADDANGQQMPADSNGDAPKTEQPPTTSSSETTTLTTAVASAPEFQPSAPVQAGVAESSAVGEQAAASSADNKATVDRRRRQSFNSFLHSHAVPFQPSDMTSVPLGPAAAMNGGHGHGHGIGVGMRGKARGRGAHSGMVGRGSRERGPCSFFAKNACKYGSECLFPHVLPDGTDARRLPNVNAHSAAAAAAGPSSLQGGDPKNVQTSNSKAGQSGVASNASAANGTEGGADEEQTQGNGFIPSRPSATLMKESAAETASPNGGAANESEVAVSPTAAGQEQSARAPSQKQQSQTSTEHAAATGQQQPPQHPRNAGQQQPGVRKQQGGRHGANASGNSNGGQQAKKTPVQRIPNGSDFPALPGSPNGASAAGSTSVTASPALGSPSATSSANKTEGPAASTAAPSASKVNFSAILSAPAPVKKVEDPLTVSEADKEPKAEEASETSNAVSVDAPADETAAQAPADSAAAAIPTNGPPASVWGKPLQTNGHVGSPASSAGPSAVAQVNGHSAAPASAASGPTKEKAAAKNNVNNNGKSSSKGGAKSWAAPTTVPKQASKEPEVDADDFQLVKGRGHGKRSTHGGHGALAKAALAA